MTSQVGMKIVVSLALALLLAPATACRRQDGAGSRQTRMFPSSGQFDKGRKDGRRDAKRSWTDDSAAWLWLWMTDEQYGHGYDQGWAEGRADVRLQEHVRRNSNGS